MRDRLALVLRTFLAWLAASWSIVFVVTFAGFDLPEWALPVLLATLPVVILVRLFDQKS